MPEQKQGDVRLDGKWYTIDLKTYRGKDVIDFAPRAATPGGSVVMSDLNLYQPLLTTDWKHGFGFPWHTDPQGYLRTDGNLDTRHAGRVMLDMLQQISDDFGGGWPGSSLYALGYAFFNNTTYEWGLGGLRKAGSDYTQTWSVPTFSGVEIDSFSSASGSGVDELTFQHTVTTQGQNRILVFRLSIRGAVTVSGLTFDGVAASEYATAGANPYAKIWYLKAPHTGTHDVVVTLSGAATINASSASYLYVDQTTPFGTAATGSGTGTSASVNVTSVAQDIVIDVAAKNGPYSDAFLVNGSQTQEALLSAAGANPQQLGASRKIATTTSTTMSWSWNNSRAYAIVGVALKAATQNATLAINCVLPTADYLFYCPDGQRIRKISTSGVDSAAGLNGNASDYRWLIVHRGYIYAGKDGSNRVHYSDQSDLSDLEGDTTDPNAIYVGLGNLPTTGAVVYAGNLYVSRADGLWHIGDDNIARNVIDFSTEQSPANFSSMVVYNGLLIFPVRDRVYQWNGSRVSDITPSALTDTFPYMTYFAYHHLVVGAGYLYAIGRTNEVTPREQLISWDGAAWHKLIDITDGASANQTVTAMAFDARRSVNTASDTLLFCYQYVSNWLRTYYWFPSYQGEFPYPAFPTTGTHSLISSRWDMGFRRVVKSAVSLLVEASNISASHYLKVYYSLDGGPWVFWSDVKYGGVTELLNPGGYHSVEFKYMQTRIDFVTTDTAQSPILESMTLRFIMRPDTRFGYNFNIIAAPNLERGRYMTPTTVNEMVKTLRVLRNKKAPVEFVDILGDPYYGYISSMTEIPVERSGDSVSGELLIEYIVQVNFVVM